jgi:hypothetical protein
MFRRAEALAMRQNYLYSFVYATNFISAKISTNGGYEQLNAMDFRHWSCYGVYPFREVD